MDFSMKVPCGDCPFRKAGGVRLSRSRIREIAGMMLRSDGGTFPCHKTVDYGREDRNLGDGRRLSAPGEIHCAGALIFAEKQGTATQLMRIAERLGMYDSAALLADQDVVDAVFDSQAEMMATALDARKAKAREVPS